MKSSFKGIFLFALLCFASVFHASAQQLRSLAYFDALFEQDVPDSLKDAAETDLRYTIDSLCNSLDRGVSLVVDNADYDRWYQILDNHTINANDPLLYKLTENLYLYYNAKKQYASAAYWHKRHAYLKGDGTEYRESGLLYLKASLEKEADECFREGEKLKDAFCIAWCAEQEGNISKALKNYKVSADKDNVLEAMYRYALLYQKEKNCDWEVVLRYLNNAKKHDNYYSAYAALELGYYYYEKNENAADDKAAFENFKIAAQHKIPAGVYCLGLCYRDGIGAKVNSKEALRLFNEAKALGEPRAEAAIRRLGIRGLMPK